MPLNWCNQLQIDDKGNFCFGHTTTEKIGDKVTSIFVKLECTIVCFWIHDDCEG
jgi:hypothetical protein